MSFQVRDSFLPYCLPDITEKEIAEVVSTLQSGWLAKGPRVMEFERQFADYIGARYAVGMSSCTAALHTALLAAGVGAGDEVITTPMTFAASANTIIHCGARPVFVDIDPLTGCIDVEAVNAAITPRAKAIVPVHYAGQACDMDVLYALADRYGLFMSEDAAHAVPTEYKNRMIGSNPHGAVSYSFYATKNLATGEGGMLVTDNQEIAERARVLVTHGMSLNAWNRYAKGGSWRYDIEEPGYKYNMFDIQAALGLQQLARLELMQQRRERIAKLYMDAFSNTPGITPLKPASYTTRHSWHLFVIALDTSLGLSRDGFIEELTNRNIGTSVHFIPVHLMSAYKKRFGYKPSDYPKTESFFERILSLPLYPSMTDTDADYVIHAVYDIIERHGR